jgi:hypothetical protein
MNTPYTTTYEDVEGRYWAATGPGVYLVARDRSDAYRLAAALNAAYIVGYQNGRESVFNTQNKFRDELRRNGGKQ